MRIDRTKFSSRARWFGAAHAPKANSRAAQALCGAVVVLLLPAVVRAEEAPPKGEMRPLSTDRPDVTESPRSVDAGHFQAEIDLARYTSDEGVEGGSFMNMNLKLGLTDFWDMQVVVESMVGEEGAAGIDWNAGDVAIRSKFNIFGNDSGDVAFGVMPWVKLPTATAGTQKADVGLITLLGVDLPADFSSGFMLEGDAVGDEAGDGYHFELLATATCGHPIVGPLSLYVEVFGLYSSEVGADYALSVDGGLTYGLSEFVQLDAGVVGGLTDAAEDLSVFSGLSFKL